jgi:hypothetical protein
VVHKVESTGPSHTSSAGEEEQESSPFEENNKRSSGNSSSTAEILKVYVSLVRAFESVDWAAFSKIVQDHEPIFTEDGNLGMVHLCHTALLRRQDSKRRHRSAL